MRAVVYQHETHEGLGILEPALKSAGFTIVKRFRGTEYREDCEAELLIVLGGSMSAGDTAVHPFLSDELAVLIDRLANDRAVLGICLGAQLLASAAGAEVFTGKNGIEIGVAPVRWTVEGQADLVTGGMPAKVQAAHWHQDTWKPISGATLLASTDRYSQQAFRIGKSYGFQFHPELTAAELGHWFDLNPEELELHDKNVADLKAQLPKLKANERDWQSLVTRLVAHFAA